MIQESQLREAFCEIGRRVWQRGFVASNDGNFSFRLDEKHILCTPTMISKGFMKPTDMVIVDIEGNQVAGNRRMTSEVRVHLFIYQQRPDVYSVVHVHPPHATAFAVAQRELPKCILPEVEVNLGPIPLTPYVLSGTWEFARSIGPWVQEHDCFLLTNHGAITVGLDPYDAYYRMETLDHYCRILLLAKQAGDWKSLTSEAMHEILDVKRRLGLRENRTAENVCSASAPASPASHPKLPFRLHPGPLTDEPKALLAASITETPAKPSAQAKPQNTANTPPQPVDDVLIAEVRGQVLSRLTAS